MAEVLILAVGDAVYQALRKTLPGTRRVLPNPDDSNHYTQGRVTVSIAGKKRRHERELVVARLADDSQAFSRALKRWSPSAVLLASSATAVPGTEVTNGQLFIAERLLDYDAHKDSHCLVKSGQSLAKGRFLKAVKDLSDSQWSALLNDAKPLKRAYGTLLFSQQNPGDWASIRQRWQNSLAWTQSKAALLKTILGATESKACPPTLGIFALTEAEAFEDHEAKLVAAFVLACMGVEPEKKAEKAQLSHQKKAEALYLAATGYLQRGQLDKALEGFKQVLSWDPDYAEAYSNRGVIKNAKGDFNGAIADYNMAIALKPDLGPAHYNVACAYGIRAKTLTKDGQQDSAAGHVDKALEALARALKFGFADVEHLKRDEDLALLRERPQFRDLLGSRE